MGKRVVCLICAAVLAAAAVFGVKAWSEPWTGPILLQRASGGLQLSKAIVKHSPNPLASAMLLILAGIAASMLFDKKNKD